MAAEQILTVIESSGCFHIHLRAGYSTVFHRSCLLLLRKSYKIRNDFGVWVEVYGVAQLTATSLIDSASKFVPIEDDLLLKVTQS